MTATISLRKSQLQDILLMKFPEFVDIFNVAYRREALRLPDSPKSLAYTNI